MPLYKPQEDSELLKRAVVEHSFGEVLDMGTGSGILAFAAAAKPEVTSVLAVDIDEESLASIRQALAKQAPAIREKVTVARSDLFSAVPPGHSFDTIICNPPYLPQEPNDEHQALYGGRHGYEFLLRFLDEARTRLRPQGQILLLFSSLTNKERVDQELRRLGYHAEELLMEAHFFEQLYVYRLWRSKPAEQNSQEGADG